MTIDREEPILPLFPNKSRWIFGIALICTSHIGCGEPCLTQKTVTLDPTANPFSDRRPLFSLCDACPPDLRKNGSTLAQCGIVFKEGGGDADCVYQDSSGIYYGPSLTDSPNPFSFCEQNCEEGDALHQCGFVVDASSNIITPLTCDYGHECD